MKIAIIHLLCILACIAVIPGALAWSECPDIKTAYESLNGLPVPGHPNDTYPIITISPDTEVITLSASEASVLPEEPAILFLGAPWCPWCRNALPSVLWAAQSAGYDHIYYVDLTDERDQFELFHGEAVRIQEGTPGYMELLKKLEAFLPDYTLISTDDTAISTGEKRIYLPTLAVYYHENYIAAMQPLIEIQEGKSAYNTLADDQRNQLNQEILIWLQDVFQ